MPMCGIGSRKDVYLIVAGVCPVECGVDFVFDRVEGVQYGSCSVEVFPCSFVVLQAELDF